MSKKHNSSFHKKNDLPEETLSLTYSTTEKNSLFFSNCIAISPDSQQIVTFSPETSEFKLFDIDDLRSSKPISTLESRVNGKHLCWSIAISNCVDDGNERFIALSCFDARGFRHDIMCDDENDLESVDKVNIQYDEDESDLESGNKVNNKYGDDEGDLKSGDKYLRPQTWIISTKDRKNIYTYSIGGVIRFLGKDDSLLKNKPVIIIVNASGIYKETMNDQKQRFFSRMSNIKQFELPHQLSIRLRDNWQNSFELLHASIIKNHFMVHSFKDRQQIIEMYSLITGDLEMLFKRHESSVAPNIVHGSPIFAISQNEKILAFCRGTTSITLYFIENGLEITTKQLEGQSIYKIVAINFIDEDSKLLMIVEKKDRLRKTSMNHQIFVVWDLFTTFKNSIRQIDYSETQPLKMDVANRLMNSHGKVFAVGDGGNIFSVLDHKDVASIRNPSAKAMTKIDIITGDRVYHAIYNMDGKRSDTTKLAKNRIIINNVEPWHPNKSYFRISVYLDSTESTQLIISSNTIQVWKYRNIDTIEKLDKRDRVLEYIRAWKKEMNVQELIIGEREFVLKVLVPSTKYSTLPKLTTIHWPNNVNVLEGACRALYVLGEKKHIVVGHKNVNQIKYLVECTQRLVRKYITKYGIFRLTSIRYPIMKYLIKSYQESLIKHILSNKIKNSNIYIPRLYKWVDEDNNRSTTEISKSDLHHSILCIQKRGDSTVILKSLIDYYADNTKEYNNYGWMFTVSKAIPLLYDNNLREFVQYLFKKPCFGITEAYTPPLHIDPYDQKKGNNAAVIHSLAIKPCLVSKFHNTPWFFLKNIFTRIEASRDDHKVYIVPLPDFTVYPNPKGHEDRSKYFWIFIFFRRFFWPHRKVITNTKKMSPFLRVIHEEKDHKIYQTPTLMAALNFKWSAARRYYIHHIIMYILHVISYTLSFEEIKKKSLYVSLIFLSTGLYLIVTEIMQIKREGWNRYMNIYNMFDLGSVLLPLLSRIFYIIIYSSDYMGLYSVFEIIFTFTDLIIWLEVLFLLRYFEGPGRFVYIITSILNTVLPFFAFMLSAVVAFGHAMFITLRRSGSHRVHTPTYKIEDTSNSHLYSTVNIKQDFDGSNRLDNHYSNFFSSIEAVFFWTNGRWDQLDQWDNYAVDVISILGSIILVLIFQNLLVAFMNGAFDKANKESRIAVHRYRAQLVAEYEALEKPFNRKSNPRYIYYIPNPNVIDTWLKETKKDEKQKLHLMGENLAEIKDLTDFDYDCDDDDDNDDDNQDNLSYSKKYQHIQNEGSSSTMDIEPSTTKYCDKIEEISFIDEENSLLKKSQRNWKSNNKLLNNGIYNEPLSEDPGPTANIDDQLSMHERFNDLENKFKTKFEELDQNLKMILQTLNNLNNPK
ncbi:hypothetical protein Glove_355g38 [Diversispora epigaea]|uniref:Ion transport domain-containing protein n=1 Tax=Diversispora epigaea TaxID=1348612 RepID=A0A397HIS6_9GLOM|nr:hypothetical protein Glove_355g38 [Diversispora epigaea]